MVTGNSTEPRTARQAVTSPYRYWSFITTTTMSLSMQEAKKKDEKLLKFPEKLQDVQSAAR